MTYEEKARIQELTEIRDLMDDQLKAARAENHRLLKRIKLIPMFGCSLFFLGVVIGLIF